MMAMKHVPRTYLNSLVFASLYPSYVRENLMRRDCVAVFPDLGLVYNRIKKAGNTSVVGWLADLQGNSSVTSQVVKGALMRPPMLPLSEVWRFGRYYSFTIVRNPYSRLLSAFLDKVASSDPKYTRFSGFGNPTREGFRAFVADVANGALHDNRHWWPQVDLLYKKPEQFSFIGKLENVASDMEKVLGDIGLPRDALLDLRSPHLMSTHSTSAAKKLEIYYDEELRSIVHAIYRNDFDAFGYDPRC